MMAASGRRQERLALHAALVLPLEVHSVPHSAVQFGYIADWDVPGSRAELRQTQQEIGLPVQSKDKERMYAAMLVRHEQLGPKSIRRAIRRLGCPSMRSSPDLATVTSSVRSLLQIASNPKKSPRAAIDAVSWLGKLKGAAGYDAAVLANHGSQHLGRGILAAAAMVDAAGDARASIGLPRQPTPTDLTKQLPTEIGATTMSMSMPELNGAFQASTTNHDAGPADEESSDPRSAQYKSPWSCLSNPEARSHMVGAPPIRPPLPEQGRERARQILACERLIEFGPPPPPLPLPLSAGEPSDPSISAGQVKGAAGGDAGHRGHATTTTPTPGTVLDSPEHDPPQAPLPLLLPGAPEGTPGADFALDERFLVNLINRGSSVHMGSQLPDVAVSLVTDGYMTAVLHMALFPGRGFDVRRIAIRSAYLLTGHFEDDSARMGHALDVLSRDGLFDLVAVTIADALRGGMDGLDAGPRTVVMARKHALREALKVVEAYVNVRPSAICMALCEHHDCLPVVARLFGYMCRQSGSTLRRMSIPWTSGVSGTGAAIDQSPADWTVQVLLAFEQLLGRVRKYSCKDDQMRFARALALSGIAGSCVGLAVRGIQIAMQVSVGISGLLQADAQAALARGLMRQPEFMGEENLATLRQRFPGSSASWFLLLLVTAAPMLTNETRHPRGSEQDERRRAMRAEPGFVPPSWPQPSSEQVQAGKIFTSALHVAVNVLRSRSARPVLAREASIVASEVGLCLDGEQMERAWKGLQGEAPRVISTIQRNAGLIRRLLAIQRRLAMVRHRAAVVAARG